MKVLYVGGTYSFAALEFEKNFRASKYSDIWKKARSNEGNKTIIKRTVAEGTMDEHEQKFIFEAYEFDEVDSDFIKFVRNEIQDPDSMKHNNFYII